jgi:hypothetical protein
MRISSVLVAASLVLASSAALAHRCPSEMKAIDTALPKAKLSDTDAAEVKKLRADGESLHKAGKHTESEQSLDHAKKILGI